MNGCSRLFRNTFFVQRYYCFSLGKLDAINFAAAPDFYFHFFAQRVNTRNTNAMQTTGNLVATVAEFTAGMQNSHDDFNRRFSYFVHINRNTAAIISDSYAVVLMDQNLNHRTITG